MTSKTVSTITQTAAKAIASKHAAALQTLTAADGKTIRLIAERAADLYKKHGVRVSALDIQLDLAVCHTGPQALRLDDMLAADDFNLMHDVSGLNRHLDVERCELADHFSPRFSKH